MNIRHRWMCFPCQSVYAGPGTSLHTLLGWCKIIYYRACGQRTVLGGRLLSAFNISLWIVYSVHCKITVCWCLSLPVSLSLSLKEDLLFLYSERFLQLHSFLLRAWVSFIKYVHQVLRQCCFSQQTGGEGWKGCGYTRANTPLQPAAAPAAGPNK